MNTTIRRIVAGDIGPDRREIEVEPLEAPQHAPAPIETPAPAPAPREPVPA